MFTKKILIDLDGVLNEYGYEKYNENYIPPIKNGAYEFIKKLSEKAELYLFTSRNLMLATKWLINNNLDKFFKDVTNTKLSSYLYIDDRCICFKGDYCNLFEEIEEFGKRKGIVKCSLRDLPIVYAKKLWGATTVAATMFLAHQAGIEFFVTGGIGGAHRKANETFDISADLEALGNIDVSVICAGPKAILDLGLTTEILETKGVPIIGFNTDCMPAFFTKTSKYKVDFNAKTPLEIAEIVKSKRDNKLVGGVLITNPVDDDHSIPDEKIGLVIEEAIKEMEAKGIKGKDETPFLLSKIVELTGGKSLETNIALILSNATLGAKIAVEYSNLTK